MTWIVRMYCDRVPCAHCLYRQGYQYAVDDQLASGELSWFVTPRASDAKVFEDVAAAWAFIKRLRISGPLEIVDLADELLAREAG